MSPLNAFFIYLLIWWIMLFMVLPTGVTPQGENDQGLEPGAPQKPELKRKLILNTILSAIVMTIVWLLVEYDIIQWHNWFEDALQ